MRQKIKDFFIPHEGNDYSPHSLQTAAMVGMAALVLITFTLANVQSLMLLSSQWMTGAVLPSVIVDMVNEARAESSLGQLTRNPLLDAAAQMKAEDMAKNQYFAHFSPSGVSPWYFFDKVNYNFVNAGENLAIHFTDTKELMAAWMASPTHRANILNGAFTEIGIGMASGEFEGFQTLYVVQFFGTPAATSPQVVSPVEGGDTFSPSSEVQLATTEVSQQVLEEAGETPKDTEENAVLSESVSITESVEIQPANQIPLTVTQAVTQLTEASSSVVAQTDMSDNEITVYSTLMTTTTGAVPAVVSPVQDMQISSWFARLFTQPQTVLFFAYIAIGLFVFVSLALSVLIEIRRQNIPQIGYSIALLLLMVGLFQLHNIFTSGATVL